MVYINLKTMEMKHEKIIDFITGSNHAVYSWMFW